MHTAEMEKDRENERKEARKRCAEKRERQWPKELQQQSKESLMKGWITGSREGEQRRAVYHF